METWKWSKLLQWNIPNSSTILGNWLEHRDDGHSGGDSYRTLHWCNFAKYNPVVWVSERWAHNGVYREARQATYSPAEIWSQELCRLHSLVLARSPRYMERDLVCLFNAWFSTKSRLISVDSLSWHTERLIFHSFCCQINFKNWVYLHPRGLAYFFYRLYFPINIFLLIVNFIFLYIIYDLIPNPKLFFISTYNIKLKLCLKFIAGPASSYSLISFIYWSVWINKSLFVCRYWLMVSYTYFFLWYLRVFPLFFFFFSPRK